MEIGAEPHELTPENILGLVVLPHNPALLSRPSFPRRRPGCRWCRRASGADEHRLGGEATSLYRRRR